jgi:hypothetical protein
MSQDWIVWPEVALGVSQALEAMRGRFRKAVMRGVIDGDAHRRSFSIDETVVALNLERELGVVGDEPADEFMEALIEDRIDRQRMQFAVGVAQDVVAISSPYSRARLARFDRSLE